LLLSAGRVKRCEVLLHTSVEVYHWQQLNLSFDIAIALRLSNFLAEGVVRVYVGLVVHVVVKLHYLAGDGRLEGAIIIWCIGL
jgi:hypothetical protein